MTGQLTPREAAKLLGITAQTIYRWIRTGKLTYTRLPSGLYRIPRSEIERILTPIPAQGRAVDDVGSAGGALPPALF